MSLASHARLLVWLTYLSCRICEQMKYTNMIYMISLYDIICHHCETVNSEALKIEMRHNQLCAALHTFIMPCNTHRQGSV